jgi:hypothetical protein
VYGIERDLRRRHVFFGQRARVPRRLRLERVDFRLHVPLQGADGVLLGHPRVQIFGGVSVTDGLVQRTRRQLRTGVTVDLAGVRAHVVDQTVLAQRSVTCTVPRINPRRDNFLTIRLTGVVVVDAFLGKGVVICE